MAKSILIADDIPFVRKTLSKIFTDAHYNVVGQAKDGQEAIDLFAQLQPDLVTMDLVMPNVSGIDATKKILTMKTDARVVIISAMTQESLMIDAINAGAKDYIIKPFAPKDVLATTERVLSF